MKLRTRLFLRLCRPNLWRDPILVDVVSGIENYEMSKELHVGWILPQRVSDWLMGVKS
jgi:hypothetical protein